MKLRALFVIYRIAAIATAAALTLLASILSENAVYIDVVIALIGVAGVVVTVFGIWIAIIFPRFVASLGDGTELSKADDAKKYDVLLKSLYRSATVLCSALFVLLITSFFFVYTPFSAAAIFAFCALCCISLFESLFSAIANGELAASQALNNGIVIGVVRRRRRERGKSA